MHRHSLALVVLMVLVLQPFAAAQQPNPQILVALSDVLQQNYDKVASDKFRKLSTYLSYTYDQMKKAVDDGEIDAGIVGAGFTHERYEALRTRYLSELDAESRECEKSAKTYLTNKQLDTYKALVLEYFSTLNPPRIGLRFVAPDTNQQLPPAQVELRWDRPQNYAGAPPRIVSAPDLDGWDAPSRDRIDKELMKGKKVGQVTLIPVAIAPGAGFASIVVHTDKWGTATYIWRARPPKEPGEALWLHQKAVAFQRGDLVAISQGCFPDRVKVAWQPPRATHDFGDSPTQYEIICSAVPSPEPRYHREAVYQTHSMEVQEFEITSDRWIHPDGWDEPDRSSHDAEGIPRVIYVQVGFYHGADGKSHQLFDQPGWPSHTVVSGWVCESVKAGG